MRTPIVPLIAAGFALFTFGCATAERSVASLDNPPPQPVKKPLPATPTDVYDVSTVSTRPIPTFQARPRYPAELQRAGLNGEAAVSFIVNTDGTVTDAVFVNATDERFGHAAVEAVQKWKFRPARIHGSPVKCRMMIPLTFRSDGPRASAHGAQDERARAAAEIDRLKEESKRAASRAVTDPDPSYPWNSAPRK